MTQQIVKVVKMFDDVILPQYATPGSSGADVFAYLPSGQLIPTGLKVQIPSGYEIQVRPRSGLALKYGITILNSPGTIDESYLGEIGIILTNLGRQDFIVENGMRIAQLVLQKVEQMQFVQIDKFDVSTERGEGRLRALGFEILIINSICA